MEDVSVFNYKYVSMKNEWSYSYNLHVGSVGVQSVLETVVMLACKSW
jgi:hypothetical protein